jgi:hypothetical protein
MRTKEEVEFNAIWFGVAMVSAVGLIIFRVFFGQ